MTAEVQANDPYNVRPWIEDRLKAMEFEQSDMLVNYVLLLIANEKNIGEITVELNELLGEDESSQFCKDLDVELTKGKNKQLKGDGLTAGQKRLLNSALTPAITGKETHHKDFKGGAGPRGRAPDAQSSNRGGSSIMDRLGGALGGHGGDDSNDALQPAKRQRGAHGAGAPQMPAQAVNPMFQQMTMMAQAQGYASADEMLVAQQQALMQAMLMRGVGAFGRDGRGRGGRGGGGWSSGRGPPEFSYGAGGRGRGGRGRGYYDSSYDSSEAGGYGGRGGGRGRGAPPPSYGRGRGAGRFGPGGRTTDPFGGRGRGRRIFEDDSKTYVRVDMNEGLPSGR